MYEIHGPRASGHHKNFAVGFCGDRGFSGHVFHTSRQAMIKTYYSTSIWEHVWYKTVVTLQKWSQQRR